MTENDFIQSFPRHQSKIANLFLSTRSFNELKKSNQKFLIHPIREILMPTTARMVEKGIWISRAVYLHPTAKIIPPVFISENCQIKANVTLGPDAIVENHCIVDSLSIIEDSLICQRSYVGESLEIRNSIIDRNVLINLSLAATVEIHDDFILSGLAPPRLKTTFLNSFLTRSVAVVLFVLTLPIFLVMKRTHSLSRKPILYLPASQNSRLWKTFDWLTFEVNPGKTQTRFHHFFQRIPLLINMIQGNLHFVGVTPRSIEDVQKLPYEWKKLYLKSKIGCITLSDLDHGQRASLDDVYASEVFYATQMGLWYDLKLIYRWLKKKCASILKGLDPHE